MTTESTWPITRSPNLSPTFPFGIDRGCQRRLWERRDEWPRRCQPRWATSAHSSRTRGEIKHAPMSRRERGLTGPMSEGKVGRASERASGLQKGSFVPPRFSQKRVHTTGSPHVGISFTLASKIRPGHSRGCIFPDEDPLKCFQRKIPRKYPTPTPSGASLLV